jgi:hypothetical protein
VIEARFGGGNRLGANPPAAQRERTQLRDEQRTSAADEDHVVVEPAGEPVSRIAAGDAVPHVGLGPNLALESASERMHVHMVARFRHW